MDKLWLVAFKDIRTRFTDRRLLLIMLAAPLAVATIIGLAFGGLGGSSSPVRDIPVAVINNDQPVASGAAYGAILANLLTTGQLPSGTNTSLTGCPQASTSQETATNAGSMTLAELIHGTEFDAVQAQKLVADQQIASPSIASGGPEYLQAAAKAAVDKDIYAAVVVIPAGFSSALSGLADPRQPQTAATITVYGNAGDSLSAGIVRSVVDSITAQLVSGNIAIGATLAELAQVQPAALANLSKVDLGKLFVCAFNPGTALVQMNDRPVQAAPNTLAGTLLVTFGSAQALFFAMFTAQGGVLSMYDERRNGTLQRILVSPTPRWVFLGGKLVGTLVSVLVQLILLVLALTIVGSIIEGRLAFIWGNDVGKLSLVLLAVSLAVSGLGIFLAGVLKNIEQAGMVGSVLNIGLGVLGGAFGFQLPRSISQFSLVYWARDAFDLLAAGHGQIWLNILVLFAQGVLFYAIGLFFFNRKFKA
jgi:ABC-type multidrug transport system permease subunit